MFAGYDYGLMLGQCYAFTVNIASDYMAKWESRGSGFMMNVNQRIRRELIQEDILGLPFCFVVESRTKSGKARCRPHLHGFAICDDPLKATKLKVAMERAFGAHLDRRGRSRAVKVTRAYAHPESDGRFRWVSYMTKNSHFYDARFGRRRVYMSHSFVAFAREGWAIRREDPIPVH
jgi:hypothetical protein